MPDEFQVVYLGDVQASAAEIFERARNAGMESDFLDALQVIDRQLKLHPREFGDPARTLAGLQLDLFRRAVSPLIVYYGVHKTKRIVFVNKIRVLPISGL